MYGHAISQFSSPFAMQRAKRREQLGHLAQMQNPFLPHAGEDQAEPVNPFLSVKEGKEKGFMPDQKPWLKQPGLFGVDRQNALISGLGLLMGGVLDGNAWLRPLEPAQAL